MPDIEISDNSGNPVLRIPLGGLTASSLPQYLISEGLHFKVVAEYLARNGKTLTQAAPQPLRFDLKISNDFQFGNSIAEIDFTPSGAASLGVNASPGSQLFDNDFYPVPLTVPASTGYVSLSLSGSVDVGVTRATGDLTFGLDANAGITLEYWRAFPLGGAEPTLGDATVQTLSHFVIPADLDDLKKMQVNDVCCVTGQGSLTIFGSFNVALPINPLAYVSLPLAQTISVQPSVLAGVSASYQISGSYQVRVRRTGPGTFELGICKEKGSSLSVDLSASAGLSASFRGKDLIAKVLTKIDKDPDSSQALLNGGLTPDEVSTLEGAIRSGLDHSLKASIDLALSSVTDSQYVFQYEIQLSALDSASSDAVHFALDGDLSRLAALGQNARGVRALKNALTQTGEQQATLTLNLLGILNYTSLADFVKNSETITDLTTGDVVINNTVNATRISALTNRLDREQQLRQLMFDSILATTAYTAGRLVAMTDFSMSGVHFVSNANTTSQNIGDYLNWFVALNLLLGSAKGDTQSQFIGRGPSTCLLRTSYGQAACDSLFLDSNGNARLESDYVEIGRASLLELLDPTVNPLDQYRRAVLADNGKFARAMEIGPSPALSEVTQSLSTSGQSSSVLSLVTGDVYDIAWWSSSMRQAALKLEEIRKFLATAGLAASGQTNQLKKLSADLQSLMFDVVKKSKPRFAEPWGLVALFHAAQGAKASGLLQAGKMVLQKQT